MTQPMRQHPAQYAAAPGASLGMWRYRDLLPQGHAVMLGEGWTPLLQSPRHPNLFLKDEGRNPTGSFYARSAGVLISQALQDGIKHVACTGPQALAIAAYAAAAGLAAHLFMQRNADFGGQAEAKAYGAELHLVEDPTAALAAAPSDWRDISAPSEAGLKTIGYELCEQFAWQPPHAVIAPEALVPALATSFAELGQQAWLQPESEPPAVYPATQGKAAVASHAGILLAPEGAAGLALYEQLLASGELNPTQRVVLINPARAILEGNRPIKLPWSMPVGGIITPV